MNLNSFFVDLQFYVFWHTFFAVCMQEIATFSVGLNSEHSKCSKKYAAFLVKNASHTYIKKNLERL